MYFRRAKSANAGMITVITNRLGDVLLLFSIGLIASSGHWSIFITSQAPSQPLLGLIVLLLAIAAFTKRAQIPFSAWLPAAIAAPTPVSALVHSSTLVTAGVYLLIRLTEATATPAAQTLVLWAGSLTILIAGVRAIGEVDIKKIVALSTLSQLGLIMARVGLGL